MVTGSQTVNIALKDVFCLCRAGKARKFLYEAHLQGETSCNSNAWQSE